MPRPKVLNLYAGLGGNRKYWNAQVTAVEFQGNIAAAYQKQFPDDTVIVGDAHAYLTEHFRDFDFIWSSPPCQSHSKMDRANCRNRPRYPDLKLYEEIIFLQTYATCPWLVENVVPYYTPLVPPSKQIGRHLFWSNFHFEAEDVPRPRNFIATRGQSTAGELKQWLGLNYEGNIYYQDNHCPAQVLRNCVHPSIGQQIFEAAMDQQPAEAREIQGVIGGIFEDSSSL